MNYRQHTDEVRDAYLEWFRKTPEEKHAVVSFVAGFNAAKAAQ